MTVIFIPTLTVTFALEPRVAWRTGQIENDQLGVVRLVHDHFVQFDGRVHASHVALITIVVPKDNRVITLTESNTIKLNSRLNAWLAALVVRVC